MMGHVTHHRPYPHVDVSRRLRWSLLGIELFAGLNALGGGVGLIITGLGMPETQLEDTPFDSFLVSGLLLAIVVGGSILGAAVAAWRRHPLGGIASVGAGGVMLGWIAIEALMIHDGRALQAISTVLALLTLTLAVLLSRTEARSGA